MIFERLTAFIEDIFELEERSVTPSTRFEEDLGADVPDLIELAMIIEEEFDVLIDDEDLMRMETVGDMVEYIRAHSDD